MKNLVCMSLIWLMVVTASAQIQKDHSMTVLVDGKEFKSQPQQIKIGGYRYITGNSAKPDQSLRIWIGGWDGGVIIESGSYLIVNGDNPDTKDNFKKAEDLGKYKGIAAIKYVLETKSPRMEYHVGYSGNNNESLDVKVGEDGYLDFTFNCSLQGTWWKEKTSATVFGGLGRIKDKMTDKAVTSATGLDQDIDPEGNGYKKLKETDKIELSRGVVKLKMKKE
ncbi:MAG: hypothetical protein SH818_15925 [Saprospiraceae bacterium]|nr:hypothetical protein [Saprospiraceae bacterium]